MKHNDYFFLCILLLAHAIRVNSLHFTSWFPIQYLLAASSKSYLNISVESETEEVVSVKPTRREIRLKDQPLKNSFIRNKVFKLANESTSAKLVSHIDKEPAKKRQVEIWKAIIYSFYHNFLRPTNNTGRNCRRLKFLLPANSRRIITLPSQIFSAVSCTLYSILR